MVGHTDGPHKGRRSPGRRDAGTPGGYTRYQAPQLPGRAPPSDNAGSGRAPLPGTPGQA
ncbi:MAG: hypothetical protein WD492_04325 [Alkalispirochaeta sp.]